MTAKTNKCFLCESVLPAWSKEFFCVYRRWHGSGLALTLMEILCVSPSKDLTIVKALVPLLKKAPVVTEIDANKKRPQGFQFSVWPILKVSETETYHGLKAIIKYLFSGTPFLAAADLTACDSMMYIADAIFKASVPAVAKSLAILIDDELLAANNAVMNKLIASVVDQLAGEKTVGKVYLTTILSILASFGVSIAPAVVEPVNNDGIADEIVAFAHDCLSIPERYAMSDPPEKKMYLSTPIYYVNGEPHIGHVFTTTLVDTMARWWNLRGIPCIYSSGTDEHGLKVQTTAIANGVNPQEWCDKTSTTFFAAFKDFDLAPDTFIRTTDPKHMEVASMLWKLLADKGYIYKGSYEGWYSKREECFVPENQIEKIEKDGETITINKEDGAELTWSSETNYMFKLSSMGDRLLEWLDANPTAVTPRVYYNQIRGLIMAGLRDISVSRQNVTWGVPVPGDPGQTMYVWIEALANYLTVAGWNTENDGIWPCDLHTVGKDIMKFHAIYWPAFLLAADVKPYKRLLVHGWWTMDSEKMSKSIGNTLDPKTLSSFWGLEAVKYFLLRQATLVSDSDYSVAVMLTVYNNDLADVLGNLVMRVTAPKLNPEMEVPVCGELSDSDKVIVQDVELLPGTVDHNVAFGRTRIALGAIWDVIRSLNKYVTVEKPWCLEKGSARLHTVNYVLCESIRIVMLCLYPFMPQSASTILRCIGAPEPMAHDKSSMFKFGLLKTGTKMSAVPILFPKKTISEDK